MLFICLQLDASSRARLAAPPWKGPSGFGVRVSEHESAGHSKFAADHGQTLPNFFFFCCPEEKRSWTLPLLVGYVEIGRPERLIVVLHL